MVVLESLCAVPRCVWQLACVCVCVCVVCGVYVCGVVRQRCVWKEGMGGGVGVGTDGWESDGV